MLWEQLSEESIKGYSAELKINLGLVAASVKSESSEKSLHARLEIVLRHLERQGKLGAIGEDAPFVRATLPMTWQEVDFYGFHEESPPELVLFSGYDDLSDISVGLIGSAAFVTGMSNVAPASIAYAQPAFWNEVVEQIEELDQRELEDNLYGFQNEVLAAARPKPDAPPRQQLEFAAKTFLSHEYLFFGSPLYVAEVATAT